MARGIVTGLPDTFTDYEVELIDPGTLEKSVRPKQFLHIDQEECIMCEGCVDICPWRCIHMLSTDSVLDAEGIERPGEDPEDHVVFVVDEDECTRCQLCVDRCPTGVIMLGKVGLAVRGDTHSRDQRHGYAYGVRF
ncbi:MAG: 4Fe-4S ferredoxin [Acidobacteria bacterium]|nr:MAG: 4Fe-4S ferredoxin [Acidobacteriota bacterium]